LGPFFGSIYSLISFFLLFKFFRDHLRVPTPSEKGKVYKDSS
jgi:hypothetical protein